MTRPGGRRIDQTREITIVYEGLDRVDGSARFGFGTPFLSLPFLMRTRISHTTHAGATQSLASVSGPIEVRPTHENPAQATLDVQIRPLAALPGTDAKALATTLRGALAPALLLARNPRTLVQIVGQALCGAESGSGLGSAGKGWPASLTASLVNAATAALLNAGSVPMRGVVCAVAVGRMADEDKAEGAGLVLDPEESELPRLAGGGCFAFMFSSTLASEDARGDSVPPCSLLWTNYTTAAPFDVGELAHARRMAEKGAKEVWAAMRESVASMGSSKVFVKREIKNEQVSQSLSGGMDVDDDTVEI